MKKIHILFCGGTITMRKDSNGQLLPHYSGDDILKKIPQLDTIATISFENITNIDSSNMTPDVWKAIALTVEKKYELYDGFVIVHGTDTMAYTASALSFAIQNLDKPIVLTGAQKAIDDIPSDALNNLTNAIKVATMDVYEVMIVFGTLILRGNRATKISESSLNAFESPLTMPLGEVSLEPVFDKTHTKQKKAGRSLVVKAEFDPNIAVIAVHPGFNPAIILNALISNCHGLIVEAFGAGNIPDMLVETLTKAKNLEVPIVVLSQCHKGITRMHIYKVGYQALKAGVIPGRDMTVEAASTKLMWALSQTKNMNEIKKIMQKNSVGELSTYE